MSTPCATSPARWSICGVMEHVEEAGVHSGDSACALPPQTLSAEVVADLERTVRTIAEALQVRGLLNVQFAVKDDRAYVLEANPRASRTVPFVAKATGVPVAMVAARVMVGATLAELRDEGILRPPVTGHVSVKEAVLPFNRFPGVDTLLGPEMRSTGEVMGIGATFGLAFAKSQIAAGNRLPVSGTVFFSLADRDKGAGPRGGPAVRLAGVRPRRHLGYGGHARSRGDPVATVVAKVGDSHPGVVDAVELIAGGKVQLVVNTPAGPRSASRRSAHPGHRPGPHGSLSHHGGRRPGRRRRDRRLGEPPPLGPFPPGVPPAVSQAGRGRRVWTGSVEPGGRSPPATSTFRCGSARWSLANPVMTASGTAGHGDELQAYFPMGRLGAVVVKSLSVDPWPGNPAPRVHQTAAGMLNSVGLQGPGIEAWISDDLPRLVATGARIVVSIWGQRVEDFAKAAAALSGVEGLTAVEVNVSCPNLEDRRRMFAHSPTATAEVVAAVGEACPDAAAVGQAEPDGGRSGRGGRRRPVRRRRGGDPDQHRAGHGHRRGQPSARSGSGPLGGGLSGPAVHPVAVRAVFDVRAAHPEAAIIGVGGVMTGADAIELVLAGADAVQVGTATFRDPRAPVRVLDQMESWCSRHGVRRAARPGRGGPWLRRWPGRGSRRGSPGPWRRRGRCVPASIRRSICSAVGAADRRRGLRRFGLRCVEALAGVVPVVKPQVAFFERFGSPGVAALEAVIAEARSAGLLVIADAKRGDMGNTMKAYASAWLDPDSPLAADAVTDRALSRPRRPPTHGRPGRRPREWRHRGGEELEPRRPPRSKRR